MSRRKLILGILLVLLLVANGYRWFQGLSQEQAQEVLDWLGLLLPLCVIVGAWIYNTVTVRRARAVTRKKEPWETEDEIKG